MASLPQPSDQEWDMTVDRGAQSPAESADESSNHSNPQAACASFRDPQLAQANEVPLVTMIKDDTDVAEPSASEEQMQEAEAEPEWHRLTYRDVSSLQKEAYFKL